MRLVHVSAGLLLLSLTTLTVTAQADQLYNPAVNHDPKDGVVHLYGAGGPHTAFAKIADAWMARTGNKVVITAGPETTWSAQAQADADILWGTSEQSMTAFLETYKTFSSEQVEPIYIRPAIIAVKEGNPKNIHSFEDLLKDGIKVVVTEGAGVANTSGTGLWEDLAGRLGQLGDVKSLRKNIVAFGKGSGASLRAFNELGADAWITWPNWPATHADVLEQVNIAPERAIWRDVNVALSPDADPEAAEFLAYLITPEAQEMMATEGWRR
ncbi:substrate-binding domain-containing protein [Halomonas cupida]|uniref:substrate-binding domain-containing protein n=1 Tax=Halomonas cupida TaxID=44933 RepID=UPI0039B45C00